MTYTVEKVNSSHKFSRHPYLQWCIRDGRGFVLPVYGDARLYDTEEAAQAKANKLNSNMKEGN